MDVGVRELKARLSEYLEKARAGEVISVTSRGRRIAQIIPAAGSSNVERGLADGSGPAPVRPIIASGRVYLRPFEPSDAELYRRWRADADPMALAGWHERAPLSLAQVEARIVRLAEDQGKEHYTFLICLAADERPIGEVLLADLDRVNGSAELGIFIGEADEWGKGYGTDAVNAIVDFGFAELRLERIWLNVWTENPRARRAYEKAGFVHEGTLRHDRYEHGVHTSGDVMSLLRSEWEALPRRRA